MFCSILLFLNIGGPEMILIVFVALMLFGGEKLPQIARGLGKGIRDFKDASEGVKREITNQINSYEEKKSEEAAVAKIETQLEEAKQLPAAEGETTEHTGATPDHTVPNTQPYADISMYTPPPHVNGEHTESAEHDTEAHATETHATETKVEPVKTTHE